MVWCLRELHATPEGCAVHPRREKELVTSDPHEEAQAPVGALCTCACRTVFISYLPANLCRSPHVQLSLLFRTGCRTHGFCFRTVSITRLETDGAGMRSRITISATPIHLHSFCTHEDLLMRGRGCSGTPSKSTNAVQAPRCGVNVALGPPFG